VKLGAHLGIARGLKWTAAEAVRLRAVHLNDARFPAGSHRDAHAHIGRGTIGAQGFRALLGWPSLTDTPAVIETPKEAAADVRNLRLLRRLRAEAARPRTGQQRR
jgi:deoxyribonuclease-4